MTPHAHCLTLRRSGVLAALLIVLLSPARPAHAQPPAEAEPATTTEPTVTTEPAAENTRPAKPSSRAKATERLQESLALLGFDDAWFAPFANDEPLTDAERDKLLQLLNRLPRIAPATMIEAAYAQARERHDEGPELHSGEAYRLPLYVRRVTREDVPQELRERLGFDHYYRCLANTFTDRVVLLVRHVPRDWRLNARLNERGSATGLFIKRLPADETSAADDETEPDDPPESIERRGEAAPELLFVADRVAWHPEQLLGNLGVDFGLFDEVQDKAALTERELFYQMLTASQNMSPEYLQRQIKRLLTHQLEHQQRLADNPDLPDAKHAAAQRALARAREGTSDVVPLFNDAAAQRGEFVVLRGEALRAVKIQVDDPKITDRFGLDHYFEVDIVTPDSQNNPIVCCLTELPIDMPLGESIHVSVRVTGFFLKSYAFKTRRSEETGAAGVTERQVAPLIVGKTLEVIPSPTFGMPTQSLSLAAGLVIIFAVFAVVLWHIRRNDRLAHEQLKLRRESLPEQISLTSADQPPSDNS